MAETKSGIQEMQEIQENQELGQEFSRRVVMECNTSGMDLALGQVVNVNNGVDIFKPAMSQDLTEEQVAEWENKNFEKAIITEIRLKSVSSNCPQPVTFGVNLFEGTPNIVNSSGALYAQQNNDMDNTHAHSNEGYTNLVNILPNEMHRLNEVVYTPQNVVNNTYINKYGSYTLTKLWENIVPFPGENYYYVDQDHVVMKIIGQNWEQLGIAPEHEQIHEGKYVKVATDVVKNCIKQLYENVIQEIPYTNFSEFGARFQANTEGVEQYKVVCELLVKYKFP